MGSDCFGEIGIKIDGLRFIHGYGFFLPGNGVGGILPVGACEPGVEVFWGEGVGVETANEPGILFQAECPARAVNLHAERRKGGTHIDFEVAEDAVVRFEYQFYGIIGVSERGQASQPAKEAADAAAGQIEHLVEVMGTVVCEHSTAEPFLRLPIVSADVMENSRPDLNKDADSFFLDQRSEMLVVGGQPVGLIDGQNPFPAPGQPDHGLGFFPGAGHGLFEDHVKSCLKRPRCVGGMKVCGYGDDDRIQTRFLQHGAIVSKYGAAEGLPRFLASFGHRVGRRSEFAVRMARKGLRMERPTDAAESCNAEANFLFHGEGSVIE